MILRPSGIAPSVFAAVLTAALGAQGNTWIVDINNGAGTHFTSLVTAIASVNDGDTLVVRAGTYRGNIATSKALTILGEGQVDVWATLTAELTNPAVVVLY